MVLNCIVPLQQHKLYLSSATVLFETTYPYPDHFVKAANATDRAFHSVKFSGFQWTVTGYHINFGGRHSGTDGVVKKIIFKTSSEIFADV